MLPRSASRIAYAGMKGTVPRRTKRLIRDPELTGACNESRCVAR